MLITIQKPLPEPSVVLLEKGWLRAVWNLQEERRG